jgi:hypothetical protein
VNVIYSDGFIEAWHTIVENEFWIMLLKFLEKEVNRI